MIKRKKKTKKVDFLLENKHYRRLHLYLYILTLLVIIIFYFLIVILFSKDNLILITIISVIIGFYLVFNRDKIVRFVSEKIQDKKYKTHKKENKENLKNTLKRIIPKPKRKINLKIGGIDTFKDRFNNLKNKFNPKKNKKTRDYIEIK